MSLLNDLAQIRERAGLPALPDPTRIQGFGEPGDAPSPGLPPAIEVPIAGHDPDAGDEFGVHDDPPGDLEAPPLPATLAPTRRRALPDATQEAPSGMLNPTLAAQLTLQKALESAAVTIPHTKLALLDKLGEWKGRKVVLTDDEYADVLAVIFRAMRRELDNDQSEILGRVVRRRRATVKPEPAKAGAPAPVVAPPRRRRARGSLLNRTS